MLIYTRSVPYEAPLGAREETARHVRAHLSSVVSETDSEGEFFNEVRVTFAPRDGEILVVGEIDREPVAPYLRDDWDPEQDVADNSLSVPSILGEQ
jgi:hypothetical protein